MSMARTDPEKRKAVGMIWLVVYVYQARQIEQSFLRLQSHV